MEGKNEKNEKYLLKMHFQYFYIKHDTMANSVVL